MAKWNLVAEAREEGRKAGLREAAEITKDHIPESGRPLQSRLTAMAILAAIRAAAEGGE